MNETGTAIATAADWRTRCDWCGWPLVQHSEHGCWEDNCSMRPMPKLGPIGERQQEIRRLERDVAKLRKAISAALYSMSGLAPEGFNGVEAILNNALMDSQPHPKEC